MAETLKKWEALVWWRMLKTSVHRLHFPAKTGETWRKLFKLCASQRLFLPSALADVDATLYIDTDTLFHRPPEHLWRYFQLV